MTDVLIYTTGGGRLGNQLLNYAHLYACSRDSPELDVVHLPFYDYVDDYGNSRSEFLLTQFTPGDLSAPLAKVVEHFWLGSGRPGPVSRDVRALLVHWLSVLSGDARSLVGGDPHTAAPLPGDHHTTIHLHDLDRYADDRVLVVGGWGVRSWSLVESHRESIRNELRIRGEHYRTARSHIEALRDRYETVLGVHVRQGDYAVWRSGEYHYSTAAYARYVRSYLEQRPESDVCVLVVSNRQQPATLFEWDAFERSACQQDPSVQDLVDFAELSLTDAILGPPSTFSALAAFLGDVPLVPLYDDAPSDGWSRIENPLTGSARHPEFGRAVK